MRVDPGVRHDLQTSVTAHGSLQPSRLINEPRTHLDAPGARPLLGRAWKEVVGTAPSAQTTAVLTAQWALETDAGRAMHGHNFAGIKATPAAAGESFRTVEGYGRARREVTARFRVYGSAEAGARDYVRLIAARYPAALEAARTGSIGDFGTALAAGGYFTADPRAYAQGLEQRFLALQNAAPPSGGSLAQGVAQGVLQGVLRALSRSPDDA
jgi:hypothetical protein